MKKLKGFFHMEKSRGTKVFQTGVDIITPKLSLSQKLQYIWNKSAENQCFENKSVDFTNQSKRVAEELEIRHSTSSYNHSCRHCHRESSEYVKHDYNLCDSAKMYHR
jgi:hypothetical protein